MDTLAKYLSDHRITDEDFAKSVGCHRTRINRIKRGKAKPSLDLAIKIERITEGEIPASSFSEAA
jgi:DNA-binding XRE family transcriptional regulator